MTLERGEAITERQIAEGDSVRNSAGTLTHVKFWRLSRYNPAEQVETIAARRQLLLDIQGVTRTGKPRAWSADPRRYERAGARAVTAPDERPAAPWMLRIYYVSAGDDRVYAEFGGLTEANARALADEYSKLGTRGAASDAECWAVRRPMTLCKGECRDKTGKLRKKAERAACKLCSGSGKVPVPPPAPRGLWRQVRFPSEQAGVGDYIYSCAECGQLEGCEPSCSVAPWNLEDNPDRAVDSHPLGDDVPKKSA